MTSIRHRCITALAPALLSLVPLSLALLGSADAFPVDGDQTVLPAKTELNEDVLDKPREVFRSQITGDKSYLISLGDLAFNSPNLDVISSDPAAPGLAELVLAMAPDRNDDRIVGLLTCGLRLLRQGA